MVQPFTAPAVMPVMICREAKKVKRMGGIASNMPVAMITPNRCCTR